MGSTLFELSDSSGMVTTNIRTPAPGAVIRKTGISVTSPHVIEDFGFSVDAGIVSLDGLQLDYIDLGNGNSVLIAEHEFHQEAYYLEVKNNDFSYDRETGNLTKSGLGAVIEFGMVIGNDVRDINGVLLTELMSDPSAGAPLLGGAVHAFVVGGSVEVPVNGSLEGATINLTRQIISSR